MAITHLPAPTNTTPPLTPPPPHHPPHPSHHSSFTPPHPPSTPPHPTPTPPLTQHLDGVKDEVHNDADNYVPKSDRPSYTSAVDVWALGGVLYELLVRVTPFASQSKNRTMRKICGGELVIPDTLSPEAADFVRQCLRVDPAERPSCSQLLAHPLVAKHCPEVAAAAREKLAMVRDGRWEMRDE